MKNVVGNEVGDYDNDDDDEVHQQTEHLWIKGEAFLIYIMTCQYDRFMW